MNILMIAPSLPYPPASGGALRVYSLLRGLHAAGHRVTLLALDDSGLDPADTPLRDVCVHVETFPFPQRSKLQRLKTLLTTQQADLTSRLYSLDLIQRLREILSREKFDLIQCEALETACYLPVAKAAQPTAKLCLDTFNAEYQLQRIIAGIDAREPKRWPIALYSWIQAGRIAHYECDMCALSDIVIAVSPEDADLLRPFRADGRIHILPSAISVDDYAADVAPADLGAHGLVFTGKMDYRPNVDAALWLVNEILPLIRKRIPDATVTLVGQQPSPRLNTLSAIQGVTLTGRVNSVVPYLRGAVAYVAPLRMGSGTRLKLLEAMAAGSPIVATPTAAAGLMPDAKSAMQMADGAYAFAEAVINLLTSPEKRATMIQAGKIAVRTHYNWTATAPILLNIYKEYGLV
jgi:glycosyltransferase involved in cell wall biosynthesis